MTSGPRIITPEEVKMGIHQADIIFEDAIEFGSTGMACTTCILTKNVALHIL